LLDDLRALVEFAQAGPIARAANRLFRTPSAITLRIGLAHALAEGTLIEPIRGAD